MIVAGCGARVAVLVVRDPDGGTDVRVWCGNDEVEPVVFEVDAGRGWSQEDWAAARGACGGWSASGGGGGVRRRAGGWPVRGGAVMRYALEKVLVHEDMSDETLAFSAVVVRGGRMVTRVRNEGRGGCHLFDWCGGPQERQAFEGAARAAFPERSFEWEDALVDRLLQRWAHEQLHPGLRLESALERVQVLCEAAIQTTREEIKAAAVALCLTVREAHPSAEVVVLEDSDQGDWMWFAGWCEHDGEEVHCLEDDDAGSLASHLYTPAAQEVEGIRAMDRDGRRSGFYEMNIDTVLRVHRAVLA